MNIKGYKYCIVLGILGIGLLWFACGGNTENAASESHASAEADVDHDHALEEASENSTSLTQTQIETVGIELGPVERKDLTATIKAVGHLRVPNDQKANVTSLYGGVISGLHVQLGDVVTSGQPIATIRDPRFVQLQEEYLTVGSQLTLAQQELERQEELNAGNAGTKRNLQQATAEINRLQSRKASLNRQIQMMGIDPGSITVGNLKEELMIKSPIGGTVSNLYATLGTYIDVSSPVAEVINNSKLHLDLQVFEKDIPKIRKGQTVDFVVTNNPEKTYQAEVFSIGSSFEDDSKTIAVHSRVLGDVHGLIDGMNISGIVSLDDVISMAVPDAAVVDSEGKFFIFVQADPAVDSHKHGPDHRGEDSHEREVNFERIEVVRGTSFMGYTGITPVRDVPKDARVVVKGAFFVNAKMNDSGEHAHAH